MSIFFSIFRAQRGRRPSFRDRRSARVLGLEKWRKKNEDHDGPTDRRSKVTRYYLVIPPNFTKFRKFFMSNCIWNFAKSVFAIRVFHAGGISMTTWAQSNFFLFLFCFFYVFSFRCHNLLCFTFFKYNFFNLFISSNILFLILTFLFIGFNLPHVIGLRNNPSKVLSLDKATNALQPLRFSDFPKSITVRSKTTPWD